MNARLFSLGITFCVTAFSTASLYAEPFKIGFIAPLTGSASSYGVAAKNGAELALQELGSKAGISIIYEDDQFEPKKTVSAYKKLTEIDRVDAVISIASTPSNAVAPLADAKRIPLFAWASDPQVSKDRTYVIRTYPTGQEEGATLAILAKKKKYQKVGVFCSINDYPASVREGFLEKFGNDQVPIKEDIPAEGADFKSYLTKAKDLGVSAYFLCLNPGQSALFARQLKELNITGEIFGCINLESKDEVENAQGALDGAWFVTVGVADEFMKKYSDSFHNDTMISGAAIHYDLIKLLSQLAIGHPDSSKLIKLVLKSGVHKGAIPTYIYRDTAQDKFLEIPLTIKRIKGMSFINEQNSQ